MNGNNGTPNDNGKVVISYGTSYSTLGATGGSETHTLTISELPTNNKSVHSNVAGSTGGGGSGAEPWAPASVNFGGSNTPFSVMQPYVVRLRIMKLY
jgi:microcystin-dependent protein